LSKLEFLALIKKNTFFKGKLCNVIAKSPTFFCNEHQELKKQNANINKEKKVCCGITTKKQPCKSVQTGEINNKWYCKDHREQAPKPISEAEEDSSDEEDTKMEVNNIAHKPNLLPVTKIENSSYALNKIICNGKFSKEERCDFIIYGKENSSSWMCPLHDERNQKFRKIEIISEVEVDEVKLNVKESIKNEPIKTVQPKTKKAQEIEIKNEPKPIEKSLLVNSNEETKSNKNNI
jgi:hypothetical protein